MYKCDLALNNLQWLIYHKTQPTNYIFICLENVLTILTFKTMNLFAAETHSVGKLEYADCLF